MYWGMWSVERILILFVSLAFVMIGVQVTLFHYRQNFHRKAMWLPVLASPVAFIVGLTLSFYKVGWLQYVFMVLMWLGVFDGLIGFYYHFKGVGIRVGGYAFRNFLIGPPVMLPLLFSAVSVLGLIAIYRII